MLCMLSFMQYLDSATLNMVQLNCYYLKKIMSQLQVMIMILFGLSWVNNLNR